jgi:predicted ferric reductase
MRHIKYALWGMAVALSVLWLAVEPAAFAPRGFFELRRNMVQFSGIVAIGAMSVAMFLALRPRWPERWCGGLDKMYRLHKWLGILALAGSVVHWLWSKGPKWAVGWGWLERPAHGPRAPADRLIGQYFSTLRGAAEGVGEWAFYAAVLLLVLALIPAFPYRQFFRTHRLLAVVYLLLAFHAVVLMKFGYWFTPLGVAMVILLLAGGHAAVIALLRRIGAGRQVRGRIVTLHYYPGVRSLETEIDVPQGWPGHQPGQFAFAISDTAEGAHPYTIASSWNVSEHRITFITKELGDHTRRLRERLAVGQEVTIEGPYGCFDFDGFRSRQIWIGGGIGITPFIAAMKHLARERRAHPDVQMPAIDLFHTTADYDETALAKLTDDAAAAQVRLHLLIDERDGRLNGERIRAAVPDWREASVWFCGPAGFGAALRRDFAAHGLAVDERFHQELFAMR